MAELLSNNPHAPALETRCVEPVPALGAPWSFIVARIVQQFSLTVVKLVVRDVPVPLFVVLASGCPVCRAPVYEAAVPDIKWSPPDQLIETVLEPVAGFSK